MDLAYSTELLASIDAGRLVIICGAGLSIPPPSRGPTAAELSAACAEKFRIATGRELDEGLRRNLEALAEFFLSSPALKAGFRDCYVDWSRFSGESNEGHLAVADLIICRAANAAICTNFDVFVEKAAERLGHRDFRPAVEGDEATHLCTHSPFLKIHGSMSRNRDKILWCHGQIRDGELREDDLVEQMRIWRAWLAANLRGRDLVIVGFWSDWSYLNDILEDTLTESAPGVVYLVDPGEPGLLRLKAPGLWQLAERAAAFHHIRESGSTFLEELRKLFSQLFLQNVLAQATASYAALAGSAPQRKEIPLSLATSELYDLRRDICGVPPDGPVSKKQPDPSMTIVGVIHLLLQAKGATLKGPAYVSEGRRIRVVNGAGRFLSSVRAEFSAGQPRGGIPEVVICDAQSDGNSPANVLRGETPSTVVRAGTEAQWVTFAMARESGYC